MKRDKRSKNKVEQMDIDKQYETLNYLFDKDVKFPLKTQELFLLQELMYRDSERCKKLIK